MGLQSSRNRRSERLYQRRMSKPRTKIEDYAFLSDTQTGALVSRDGCVDWLCFPRFDSPACFASLLGEKKNGHWRFFPEEKIGKTRRRYRDQTLILETEIETKSGAVRLIDFMPPRGENPDIIRIVEGLRGKMSMQMELIVRFDYGQIVPWVRKRHDGLEAIAGPDGLILRTAIETRGKDLTTVAEFTVAKGDRVPFVLTWFVSHKNPPRKVNAEHALRDTEKSWREWLLRAIAGSPAQMQAIYGVRGERRLDEYEIPWLSGYEDSKPVRIGIAASNQLQLDVYGEILAG